jgi:simple sugar transport system substrate-binding protein
LGLSLAAMATNNIPTGFNIYTGTLYEKDQAAVYDKLLSGK